VPPFETAALQQELQSMSQLEVLRLFLDLEPDDPRFTVVEAVMAAQPRHRGVGLSEPASVAVPA